MIGSTNGKKGWKTTIEIYNIEFWNPRPDGTFRKLGNGRSYQSPTP